MIRYEKRSTCEILRADSITAVTVESAQYGEWQPAPRRTAVSNVALRLHIDRVFKGDLVEGQSVETVVQVYEHRSSRWGALQGVWSLAKPAAGVRVVVFSSALPAGVPDSARFSDDHTFLVSPYDEAARDVECAIQAGMPELSVPMLLTAVRERRATWGLLFARYVSIRMIETLFISPAGFAAILKEAEAPETADVFRRVVYMSAFRHMMAFDPAPSAFLARLIWGSLRLITTGLGESLKQPVMEVYMPNMLGLQGGLRKKTAREVFAAAPAIQQHNVEMLRTCGDVLGSDRILAWFLAS